ncbi:UPF0755 protein [Anaerobacterium chartisolvens]|uniref:Endolytic murein transglycosylase n=1 Tax=Anaerobacterium chartisolvens TaxID=1297424 RepID=A0A369BCW0_9FIRM|nr:endolytic transglycosylase MltG [Anaerobacterium chartisolvens]RCX19390.1 UPF0755 protein [Anaerobacterium chartisolvens]
MSEDASEKDGRYSVRNKIFLRLSVFVLIVLLTAASCMFSYKYVMKNVIRNEQAAISILPEDEVHISIPRGSGTGHIADILKENKIISSTGMFKLISKINGFDGAYRSGEHIVSPKLGYVEIMAVLTGDPLPDPGMKVTIPEGYNYKQLVKLLSEKGLIDENEFARVVHSEELGFDFLKDIPKDREHRLEGYLFPETYEFEAKDGREKEIINKMLEQFGKVFTAKQRDRAKELGMSTDEIITLASIIEREARVSGERARISGVFYNRLKSKDKTLRRLQSCATIQYILYSQTGKIKDVILNEDTEIDSPYNTYIHEGLPPGPICSPGEESIMAALYPEDHSYMFFVAKEDGSGEHFFSKTYNEHLSAQAKAQRTLKSR